MIRLYICILVICFLAACTSENKKHKVVDLSEQVYQRVKKNKNTKKYKQLREALLEKTTEEDLERYREWLEK